MMGRGSLLIHTQDKRQDAPLLRSYMILSLVTVKTVQREFCSFARPFAKEATRYASRTELHLDNFGTIPVKANSSKNKNKTE